MHEATHIDLNLKIAICDECAIKATQKKAHEVVNLHKIVNESRCVLVNLESQIEELVKDNRSAQTRGGSLVQMISTKKQRFKQQQEQKLKKVIKLLNEEMEKTVRDFSS